MKQSVIMRLRSKSPSTKQFSYFVLQIRMILYLEKIDYLSCRLAIFRIINNI